jgi:truncated hemoglobin YjbI
MCQGIYKEASHNTENLIERVGGAYQYDFLVLTYSENINNDKRLVEFFKDYDVDAFESLQKNLLDIAFQYTRGRLTEDETRNQIVFQNYALFEKGLNEHHFDMIHLHFIDALHDCWIEDETFDLCEKSFGDLRCFFEDNGRDIKNMFIEQQAVGACILTHSYRKLCKEKLSRMKLGRSFPSRILLHKD